MNVGDLNLDPHSYIASTLPIEPFPSHLFPFLFTVYNFHFILSVRKWRCRWWAGKGVCKQKSRIRTLILWVRVPCSPLLPTPQSFTKSPMHTLTHMLAYLLTWMPSLCWSPFLSGTKSASAECWDSGVLSFAGARVLAIDRGIRKCFVPWTLVQLKLSSLPRAWSMLEPGAWLVEWHAVFAWNHKQDLYLIFSKYWLRTHRELSEVN